MFHFKKFSIDDSKAAMKIGTDAVLLGAWVHCEKESRILDIGTGSGILALMMAQRNQNTSIDAVEIEQDAAALADQNIVLSPWSNQIQVFNTPIQSFSEETSNKYSLIICNPPFFTDSLKAPDNKRNLARHNDNLPVAELLACTNQLLTNKGKASFIIPVEAHEYWKQEAAKNNLFPLNQAFVSSSPLHEPHRVMITFSHEKVTLTNSSRINIYESKSVYSKVYQELTKDFYLHF
jgi:tRNA1Val (adenine37-N6)-methyltransferase